MKPTASAWFAAASLLLSLASANAEPRPRYGGTLRVEMTDDAETHGRTHRAGAGHVRGDGARLVLCDTKALPHGALDSGEMAWCAASHDGVADLGCRFRTEPRMHIGQ